MFAQDPIAIKLTEKEGLPDVEFYDIIEDAKGYIWLAADKGLYRFDGKEYVLFTHPEKRGFSVFGLKFDSKNRLWCNTISGQFFFLEDQKMHLFLDLKNELKGELAEFFFLDENLYVFSTYTIFSFNMKTKVRREINLPVSLKSSIIRSPYLVKDSIRFTANDFICSLSKSNLVTIKKPKLAVFGNRIFPKFFNFQDNQFLLLNDNLKNENYFFKLNNEQLQKISFPEVLQHVRIIKVISYQKKLWFCTSNGIIIATFNGENIELQDVFLKNNFITNAIFDKNGSVWVSTLNNGVYIIPNLQIKSYEQVVTDELISASIRITPYEIAIGTTKGNVFIFNLITGKKENIKIENERKIASLLYFSAQKKLLISVENDSYVYDLYRHELIKSFGFTNAKDIKQIKGSNKFIYAGFDRATVNEFVNQKLKEVKLLNDHRAYYSFYDEKKGEIYISFVDEVVCYDKMFQSTTLKYKNQSITAKDICQTKDQTIWISTFTEGVLGFKNHKLVATIDKAQGLHSNVIQRIETDGDDLWIITDKGIQKYNSISKKMNSNPINTSHIEKNIKNIIINPKSILFISSQNIYEIDKAIQTKKYHPNNIILSSISINEKDTILQERYNLPYHKNRIQFTFHTNGYYPERELQFYYKLEGFSNEWIPVDSKTDKVSFASLPPKSYIFQIKAETSSKNPFFSNKIHFQIQHPFWKRWWFLLLVFLSLFGVIVLFYRNKLAIQEKEKELALKKANFESELAILKLENLKSQMNPHFIFNALNSIQEYIILNQRQLASSYLAKFADLIRAYLEHSSKGYISLKEEIECLNTYLELEKLRFEDKFNYFIQNNVQNVDIKIPTMLIQPYVENAIKHGLLHKKDNRVLKINFVKLPQEQTIQCVIIDNGIGREKAAQLRNKKHSSFATRANQNRLELLNFGKEKKIGVAIDDLKNENNKTNGTQVTLLIPIMG